MNIMQNRDEDREVLTNRHIQADLTRDARGTLVRSLAITAGALLLAAFFYWGVYLMLKDSPLLGAFRIVYYAVQILIALYGTTQIALAIFHFHAIRQGRFLVKAEKLADKEELPRSRLCVLYLFNALGLPLLALVAGWAAIDWLYGLCSELFFFLLFGTVFIWAIKNTIAALRELFGTKPVRSTVKRMLFASNYYCFADGVRMLAASTPQFRHSDKLAMNGRSLFRRCQPGDTVWLVSYRSGAPVKVYPEKMFDYTDSSPL